MLVELSKRGFCKLSTNVASGDAARRGGGYVTYPQAIAGCMLYVGARLFGRFLGEAWADAEQLQLKAMSITLEAKLATKLDALKNQLESVEKRLQTSESDVKDLQAGIADFTAAVLGSGSRK